MSAASATAPTPSESATTDAPAATASPSEPATASPAPADPGAPADGTTQPLEPVSTPPLEPLTTSPTAAADESSPLATEPGTDAGAVEAAAGELLVGSFESISASGLSITVRGWALDASASASAVVGYVVDEEWSEIVDTDIVRTDVGAAYPGTGNEHGFLSTFQEEPGLHEVCAFALVLETEAEAFLGCRTVNVTATLPIGNFESLTAAGTAVTLSGWALDRDQAGPVDVHFYVNGAWGGSVRTDVARSDVARLYPGAGQTQGFSRSFTAGPGTHQVCTYAIDTTYGTNTPMGCRTVTVGGNKLPVANFESLTATGPTVTLTGWAVDPDTNGPIDVHFYVNGGWGGSVNAHELRRDVGAAYPGTGDLHGFTRSFTAGPGTHQVCTYAIDTTTKANTPMGCRTITVSGNRLPVGNFELLTAEADNQVVLRGWAFDPDAPGGVHVHYYVNGAFGGDIVTSLARPDVKAAYPGAGTHQGFLRNFVAGPGTHQVCLYAIDTTTQANTPMGCRSVTVG
ncbi:hypothetical protein [Cellulomonas cellasea]|uniref:hypothetical protein n=1 Tax=Cellulomonas cellasea TaxID=43670 RepID=UPI001144FCC8|nr:hypothetical protein [Cellulomonas cellasea]